MTLSRSEYAALYNALETAAAIMREQDVVSMLGEAYWSDEASKITAGLEALNSYEMHPKTFAARHRNEHKAILAAEGIDMMGVLLQRAEFLELENKAWTAQDKAIIRAGFVVSRRVTAHCRN